MACICLHNMCIVDLNGFRTNWSFEGSEEKRTKTNSTFDNINEAKMFKMVEKIIKQMKRSQNLK
jgi:hypothetical protein